MAIIFLDGIDLTNDQIDALPAGHDLDVLIHQVVFEKRVQLIPGGKPYAWDQSGNPILFTKDRYIDPDDDMVYLHATDGYQGMIPKYSTNDSDAALIRDKLISNGCEIDLWYGGNFWACEVSCDHGYSTYSANSVPLALCRVALKALKAVRDK